MSKHSKRLRGGSNKITPAQKINSSHILYLLNVETQNVRGLKAKSDWFQELKRPSTPDIWAIQETHISTEEDTKKAKKLLDMSKGLNSGHIHSFWSKTPKKRAGVGLIFNPDNSDISEITPAFEEYWNKRFIAANFKWGKENFTVINIYASNRKSKREKFFDRIRLLLSTLTGGIIVCGDFNVVIDNAKRLKTNHQP